MPENSRLVATASAARDVLAFGACFTPGNAHVVPSPVRAGTTGTEDIDVGRTALDGAGHAVKCEIGDWDAASWCSGWAAVLIILLDDNTVIGDSREGDILVSHARDRPCGIIHRLNSDAILAVLHCGGLNGDAFYSVVAAAAD